MGIRADLGRKTSAVIIALLLGVVALSLTAAGCGGSSSPEAAAEDFINAVSSRNFDAYLRAVLPENVKRMTEDDKAELKKQFESSDTKYINIKFKAVVDKSDKNKATVELTSGTITGTNPQTNQKESYDIADIVKQTNQPLSLTVRKYKGNWYVDVPVASSDQTQQQ